MHHHLTLASLFLASVSSAQGIQVCQQDPRALLTGSFDKEPIPSGTIRSNGIAIADIDGDGNGDLLVSAMYSSHATIGSFRYYRGRGDGTFEDVTATATIGGAINLGRFVLADIDGDRDLDVCGTEFVLRNRAGVLVQEVLPAASIYRHCVAAGDVDGDGDVDLFLGVGSFGGSSQQDRLLLNNGNGGFQYAPVNRLPVDNDLTQAATFADFDGDGDLDLVMGIELQFNSGGGARLYLNNGAGTFTDASANLVGPLDDGSSVLAGDFDGDGDQDIVLGTGADPYGVERPDQFFRNQGSGQFVLDSAALPPVLATTVQLVASDLDGDGDLDLLLADGGGRDRQQRVYRNDGTGFSDVSTAWLPGALLPGVGWAVGALDADPWPDAALVTGTQSWEGRVRVYQNRGGTAFLDLTPTRLPPSLRLYRPGFRFADVDRDGDLDAFLINGTVTTASGLPQRLLRNDGAAGFTDVSATDLTPVASAVNSVAFADTDRDGDLDLVLGTGAGVALLLNDGAGRFVLPPAGTIPALPGIGALVVGDVDGDGDLDIFAGTGQSSSQDELLRNDGTGRFTRDPTALPTRSRSVVFSVVMLDYDGDGDLDLIPSIGIGNGGQLAAYANNGSGQFAAASGVFVGAGWCNRVQTFDADSDGDLDLVLTYLSSTTFLLDQGTTLVAAQPSGPLPSRSAAVDPQLFDYEGDGDLDLAVRNGTSLRLWRNDGGFCFVEAPTDLASAMTAAVIEGADLDGDGDADFLAAGSSGEVEPALLLGRRIQLHAPWLARVGLPYELRLHTAAWDLGQLRVGGFVIHFNPLVPALQLPPIGVLRVDPVGAMLLFGIVPIGGDRSAEAELRVRFSLPNAPALRGATFYAQALAVATAATLLSNRVADVIH